MEKKKFRKLSVWILIIIILSTGCDLGCSSSVDFPEAALADTSIPVVETEVDAPEFQGLPFPLLSCERIQISEISPGQEWGNFQIGVTTYDDLVTVLEEYGADSSITWDEREGNFYVYMDKIGPPPLYYLHFSACFIDGILVSMDLTGYAGKEMPSSMSEMVNQYGYPDVVTWGRNAYYRTLVWLDLGILIQINIDDDSRSTVILFPPFYGNFVDSWIEDFLPDERGIFITESGEETDRIPYYLQSENPWDTSIPWNSLTSSISFWIIVLFFVSGLVYFIIVWIRMFWYWRRRRSPK